MNFTNYGIVGLILFVLVAAAFKKQNSYDIFVMGAKEGLGLFVNMFPAMLSMFVAIKFAQVSGLMEVVAFILSPILSVLKIPADIIPMVLFRPISGSGSIAVMVNIFEKFGPDSLVGMMASIIQGSTDTTLYVLSLYFGSIGIKKTKYALKVGLIADFIGISCAIILTLLFVK